MKNTVRIGLCINLHKYEQFKIEQMKHMKGHYYERSLTFEDIRWRCHLNKLRKSQKYFCISFLPFHINNFILKILIVVVAAKVKCLYFVRLAYFLRFWISENRPPFLCIQDSGSSFSDYLDQRSLIFYDCRFLKLQNKPPLGDFDE